MAKFTKKTARPPAEVGTSALPDITFMLLFFFMVVTVLRDHQLLLRIEIPEASQVQKLKHRSLVQNVFIGPPREESKGTVPVIQVNDAFVRVDEVQEAVVQLVSRIPEPQQSEAVTSLWVDKKVEMGIVSDVKRELRKAERYKLNYTAKREVE